MKHNSHKFNFLISHANELLELSMPFNFPVDISTKKYFSKKRYLGSKDKKIISEIIYFIVRNKLRFNIEHNNLVEASFLFLLLNNENFFLLAQKLLGESFLSEHIINLNDKYKKQIEDFLLSDEINSYPLHLIDLINDNQELISQNTKATTDIRVISNKDKIIEELIENSHVFHTNLLDSCIKIDGNINLRNFNSFQKNYFEVQDEGSQIIGHLIQVNSGDKILDACAGAGGKSLHLADLYPDSDIYSSDINKYRLQILKDKLKKHPRNNIKAKEINAKEYENYFDILVLDLPCSGSGTLRRNPHLRYNINRKLISELNELQYQILEEYYISLKKNGLMIYITCSIVFEENIKPIKSFCEKHNLEALKLDNILKCIHPKLGEGVIDDKYLQLKTSKFNTDGFFCGIFVKK